MNKQKTKLFIPLICYNRTCHTDYMMSVLKLLSHMHKNSLDGTFYPIFFDSLISRARNAAAAEFMSSDCTHLLFIDADIAFDPDDVIKLIVSDKDVICSPYPKKYFKFDQIKKDGPRELVDFAVSGEVKFHSDKEFEIESVATGFLLISKNVFTKLIKTYPEIEYILAYNLPLNLHTHILLSSIQFHYFPYYIHDYHKLLL